MIEWPSHHAIRWRWSANLGHLWVLCAILWYPLAYGGATPTPDSNAPLHFTTADMLNIEGRGFSPPPYAVNPADLRGEWARVDLPHAPSPRLAANFIPGDGLGPETVVTWYRVQIPAAGLGVGSIPKPRYLYIPRWKTDGQLAVYGDSRMLYQSHANLLWNGSNVPLWIALDESADAVLPQVILLRIEHLRNNGGGISTLWLGDSAALSWRYHLRNLLQTQLPFMSSAAFLAVGLFAFFVWLKQRREFLYLLFFVVSLSAYLRTMHYYVGQQRLLVSDEWFGWVTVSSLFWLVAAVHFFLVQLHQRPQPWLNRTVIGATAAISIVTLPIISTLLQTTNLPSVAGASSLIYVVLLVMGITAYSFDLRSSWQVKSRDGMLLASWSLLSFLFGVYDWMLQSNYVSIEGSYLGSYANFSAYLIFMSILFRRYIGAIDDVQQINASLAQRLQIRETELTESHQRLRKIEHQQVLAQERQRLTQDMHDGLGSSLVSALRVVERGKLGEADIVQVLKGCIDDLKLAIDSMESVDADLLLLLATLRFRLGPRLESTGIALRWEVEEVPALDWLDPKNSLHILRILQEAFTNIIKHTRATEIRVATKTEGDFVVVTITDNGLGFALEQALKSAGKGLANQQRRAQAIGGEVSWVSNDAGTSVALRLPIRAG